MTSREETIYYKTTLSGLYPKERIADVIRRDVASPGQCAHPSQTHDDRLHLTTVRQQGDCQAYDLGNLTQPVSYTHLTLPTSDLV